MNKINLVIFSSALHDSTSVMGSRLELFEGLRRFADMETIYPSMLVARRPIQGMIDGGGADNGRKLSNSDAEKTVCFIATGGTEEMFRGFIDLLPRPVLLLCDGLHNSLAASLEIKSYLAQRNIPCALFNAPLDDNPEFYESFADRLFGPKARPDTTTLFQPLPKFKRSTLKFFEKSRIGLIGGASDWLIASGIDRKAVETTYGAKFIDIPLKEIERDFIATAEDDPEIGPVCLRMERYLTGDRKIEDLKKAARMYVALRKLCTRNTLNALTIKCFGIIDSCRTTACLALSLLNDEGIVSGCEGDIPALWTMMYVRFALGQSAFMANPSSTNRKECTMDFAHCTIPLSMVHGYRLPSHFESQLGIGIAGSVPSGRYRVIKITGAALDQYYETEGDIIMNTNIPQRCRTQIRFRFASEEEFDRFFRVSKGNHIILCRAAGPGAPLR